MADRVTGVSEASSSRPGGACIRDVPTAVRSRGSLSFGLILPTFGRMADQSLTSDPPTVSTASPVSTASE